MDKKEFHKKWYYQLLRVIFLGSLLLILGTLLVISALEDDIPMAGLFWAIAITLVYWLIKRVFYYIMFGERILAVYLNFKIFRTLTTKNK